jgi:hypothetical protein
LELLLGACSKLQLRAASTGQQLSLLQASLNSCWNITAAISWVFCFVAAISRNVTAVTWCSAVERCCCQLVQDTATEKETTY